MKLYILKPIIDGGPWEIPYDKVWGFIINAKDEFEARTLANTASMDEGKVWTDYAHVSCQELKSTDKTEIVMINAISM